ncbi:hypothetical protein [uncultured Muribaculum sp.]|uniref:hypothetical protein n=1 Tax=uncultured Muribaculum sp. TaxID=1918613 RepID=UPI0025F85429|nr:hypothetical protein [uncultured Muribaculum sp.]
MSKHKTRNFIRYTLIALLVLLTMASYGASMGFYGMTVINPWIPGVASLIIALLIGSRIWRLWQFITGSDNMWINLFIHTVVITGVVMGAFYTCNYLFADDSSLHKETAVVERRYKETRHRSKRVGRRTYTRGEPYNVYFIEVRILSTGALKSLSAKQSQYSRIHKGDTLRLDTETGLFGFPVILRKAPNIEIPPSDHRFPSPHRHLEPRR